MTALQVGPAMTPKAEMTTGAAYVVEGWNPRLAEWRRVPHWRFRRRDLALAVAREAKEAGAATARDFRVVEVRERIVYQARG